LDWTPVIIIPLSEEANGLLALAYIMDDIVRARKPIEGKSQAVNAPE
jgi:hypothetical protein